MRIGDGLSTSGRDGRRVAVVRAEVRIARAVADAIAESRSGDGVFCALVQFGGGIERVAEARSRRADSEAHHVGKASSQG